MSSSKEYSEEFLYWVWSQGYLRNDRIVLLDGRQCRIFYPGERNEDGGPDFRKVNIEIDGKIATGDVEIHRSSNDWIHHNHHRDSKYNQVLIHAVLSHAPKAPTTTREDGIKIPVLIFSQNTTIQLDLLHRQYLGLQRASGAARKICLHRSKSPEALRQLLEKAGDARMKLKISGLKEQRAHDSWEQIIYRGLMEALGYSKNQIPFRQLSNRVPAEFIFRELNSSTGPDKSSLVQGILFGAAGLLPYPGELPSMHSATRELAEHLKSIWEEYWHRIGIMPMRPDEWQFFRLRPQNFPTRRLAGMCVLLVRFFEEGFLKTILRMIRGLRTNFDMLLNELEKMLICEASGYWRHHFRFEEPRSKNMKLIQTNLIGTDRARDMVVNIILPTLFLYANEAEDGQLLSIVKEMYNRYPPLSDNIITREMAAKLFQSPGLKRKLVNSVQRQQGLIHLNKNYCSIQDCDRCAWDFV